MVGSIMAIPKMLHAIMGIRHVAWCMPDICCSLLNYHPNPQFLILLFLIKILITMVYNIVNDMIPKYIWFQLYNIQLIPFAGVKVFPPTFSHGAFPSSRSPLPSSFPPYFCQSKFSSADQFLDSLIIGHLLLLYYALYPSYE